MIRAILIPKLTVSHFAVLPTSGNSLIAGFDGDSGGGTLPGAGLMAPAGESMLRAALLVLTMGALLTVSGMR